MAAKVSSKRMVRKLVWMTCVLVLVGIALQFLFSGNPSAVDEQFEQELYTVLRSHGISQETDRITRFWTGEGQTHFIAVTMSATQVEELLDEIVALLEDGTLSNRQSTGMVRHEIVSGPSLQWEWKLRIKQSPLPTTPDSSSQVRVTIFSDSGLMRVTTIYDNLFPPDTASGD